MSRFGLLKTILYPFRFVFGSGLGNVRLLKYIYKLLVSLTVPKQSVVVDVDGCKLGMVVGGDMGLDSLGAGLMLGSGYEIETTAMFKSLVKPGMTVVDVGAHIGYYTVLAFKLVGAEGRVMAFEPEPRNYQTLSDNIRLNNAKNVCAFQQAVGERNGIGRLHVSDGMSGECSLVKVKSRPNRAVGVSVTTLDNALDGVSVDVLKVDVDGGEMGVFAGAKRVLADNPDIKLFAELWPEGLKDAGYSTTDYWNILTQSGFGYVYLLDDRRRAIQRAMLADVENYLRKADGVNLLCSKRELDLPFRDRIPNGIIRTLHKRVHKRLDVLCGLIKEGDRVLEVGCGTGANVVAPLKYLPIELVALDNNHKSLEYATAKHSQANVKFVLSDGETYQVDRKFDVIVCSHILEHLPKPEEMLENMKRLLKDGGILFVAVPNGYGCFEVENYIPRTLCRLPWGAKLISRMTRGSVKDSLNANSQHVRFFSAYGIESLLRESGWAVESRINEEFLGGVVTDRTLLRLGLLAEWNLRVAEVLPSSIANGWIFVCRKKEQ